VVALAEGKHAEVAHDSFPPIQRELEVPQLADFTRRFGRVHAMNAQALLTLVVAAVGSQVLAALDQ
jgi:hypothetical protein